MATISVSLPTDGTTADTSDYNTPITTIVNEINGNLDNANIKSGAAIATSKLADDAGITTAKIAADAVTATKIDWASTGADGGIWWEELGRATLSSAGDTISVSSIPARKYLKIFAHGLDTGGTITMTMRFNNDSGSNYAFRRITNAADAVSVSQTSLTIAPDTVALDQFATVEIVNLASAPKMIISQNMSEGVSGAGTAPAVRSTLGKWQNTTDQITRVDVVNSGAGDFAIGSEVVVLGHN